MASIEEELLRKVIKIERDAKDKGDNYNIFEILGAHKEDNHSRFLANLLNPKGIHGCGHTFLELFFKKFLPDKSGIDFSKCKVYREYPIAGGRRLDIYVNCNNFGLVIENKIYADDQPQQLVNYNKFLESIPLNDYRIFYLTLNGKKATEKSCCVENSEHKLYIEYKRLAYNKSYNYDNDNENNNDGDDSELIDKDILEWLKCCQEKVSEKRLILATLEQYLNLNLVGGNKMKEEDFKVITENAESMRAAYKISKNLLEIKPILFRERLLEPLLQLVEDKKLILDKDRYDKSVSGGWYHVVFKKKEWEHSYFRFCVKQNWNLDALQYGLIVDDSTPEISQEIRNKMETAGFKRSPDADYNHNHIFYLTKDIKDWNEDSFAELCEPNNEVLKSFEKKIDELIAFFQ